MSVNVDPVLAAALAPVLRDLDAGHVPEPRIGDPKPDFYPGSPSLTLIGPDATAWAIRLQADAPRAEQLAHLADQVQEWAIELLWALGKPVVWPECPDHPDSHPLETKIVDEYTPAATAVWSCPQSGHVVAEIGQLSDAGGSRLG